jgi:hypothetical protein
VSVLVPYVIANSRTPAKVEHVVQINALVTVYREGSYVVPVTVDINGLSLTPSEI